LLVTSRYADAPGEVQVTGVEQFGSGEDDAVWVATLDDSELGELQSSIKAAADRFGFKDASSFPDYRPHVTLGKKTGEEPPEAPTSVTLGPLEAWWGNDHIR
jgi:2'-5' RNA ligase